MTLVAKWQEIYTVQEVDGGIEILAYNDDQEIVEIPSTMNGLPVVSLASMSFANISARKIVVPNTVTNIGDSAFFGCSNLKELVLPGSIETYGANLLYGCNSLESLTLFSHYANELKYWFNNDIDSIPASLTKIYYVDGGKGINLTMWSTDKVSNTPITLYLAKGTEIKANLFREAMYLESIVIPEGATYIGNYAFYKCYSLKNVVIPDSVTAINNSAFNNCTSMEYIDIPKSVKSIGNAAFANCDNLKSVEIPYGVTKLDDYVFHSSDGLQHVTIPDTVTYIGISAFAGCRLLEDITIPDGVTYIGEMAFFSCQTFTRIVIPNTVTYIGSYAFQQNFSLLSIFIPKSVTTIEDKAFYVTTKATIYTEHESAPAGWGSEWNYTSLPVFWGCTFSEAAPYLVSITKTDETPTSRINNPI